MKIATTPVNWNSPDVPEYRPWTPYPQLLKEMQEAGYSATEWGTNMPKDPALLGPDLDAHGLQMLGGFVVSNFAIQPNARQRCKGAWKSVTTSNRLGEII
jgi:inosose dehydratase